MCLTRINEFHMKTEVISPDNENDIFRLATDFVNETSQHLFLTGKAGTGKTTFLKYISKHSHKRTLITAPTGVAAINAGGVTMHSLFQLPFEPYIPNSRIKDSFKFGKAKIDLLRQVELLIIDEVSMVRCDMLDAVDSTLRFIRRDARPFGGVQMLYIGDMFQLPPVVKDETWDILKEYYKSPFFFHAKAIERIQPVYLELKKVYRQREQLFVDLLNRVRNDQLTPDDIVQFNQRYIHHFEPSKDEKYIILTTHNYQADRINTEKLAELPTVPHIFEGEVKGEFPDYALPTDLRLELKVGAQIMFLKNDTSEARRYFNGKLAEVTRIEQDEIYAIPLGQDTELKIVRDTWKNVRFTLNKERGEIEEEELGSYVQYPIRTAWAITIHKSQGLTFERAVIDIGQAFAAGQAYVALSRCTSLEGIVLRTRITASCIRTDEHALAFSNNEQPVEMLEEMLGKAKQKFWGDRLFKYFDWRPLLILLNEYRTLTRDKVSDDLRNAHELSEELFQIGLNQEQVAKKFQVQLQQLVSVVEKSGDLAPLKERSTKAILFFYEDIRTRILLPLQQHKAGFTKMKKARMYWKALNMLEEDIITFTMQLTTVRYNNELMLEGAVLASLRNHDVFSSGKERATTAKDKAGTVSAKEKSSKLPVGGSKKLSLELFLTGKTIVQISKERNLAESTITGHLVDFIKDGQLPVTAILPQEKIDVILPLVKSTIDGDKTMVTPIREQLGEAYTFSEIKAVVNHWLWLSTGNGAN